MNTVIVDLDSTLCDTSHRHGLQPTGPERSTNAGWHAYSLACTDDVPIPGTVALLRSVHPHNYVVVLSARAHVAYANTVEWLYRHDIPFDELVLRPDAAPQDPTDFKLAEMQKLRDRGLELALVIDDYHVTCARAATELGVPYLHVHQPATYAPANAGLPL